MKGIVNNFIQFAVDEGRETALARLEKIQLCLTDLLEIGIGSEYDAANRLLVNINRAIDYISKGEIVDLARRYGMGSKEFDNAILDRFYGHQ